MSAAREQRQAAALRDHGATQVGEVLGLELELALLGGEDLALEVGDLGGHVALGIHQRLLAGVVVRHALLVRLGDLDVVPEDLVVTDLERRDAGALALALLDRQDVPLAVVGERPAAVEFGVYTGGDDAAFAHGPRRSVDQQAGELGVQRRQRVDGRELGEERRGVERRGREIRRRREVGQDRRRGGEAVAQRGGLARSERAEDGAPEQALRITHPREALAQAVAQRGVAHQRAHGGVAPRDARRIAQRPAQPVAQQAAARSGHRAVEHAEQAAALAALALGLQDFEIGQGRRVEMEILARLAQRQAAHVGQRAVLCLLGVAQRLGRRDHRRLAALEAEAAEGADAELPQQRLLRLTAVERRAGLELGAARTLRRRPLDDLRRQAAEGAERFPRPQQAQLLQSLCGIGESAHEEGAGRDVEEGRGAAISLPGERRQQVFLLALEQRRLAHRARRHHPGDLAAHQTLGLRRVLHLVTDRDLEAGAQELADVALDRVVRHAAHRGLVVGALLAGGQGDFEDRRSPLRIVEEELEEVAHPIHHDAVRMLRLDLQVVAQHGGHFRDTSHGGGV